MGSRYKVLDHLPPYGPMYVTVSESGHKFYSEGYVVQFTRTDGTTWVANFETGWSGFDYTCEFENGKVFIIAHGIGYLMHPNSETPEKIVGIAIKKAIPAKNGQLVLSDDTCIMVLDPDGKLWTSPRISWDGIEGLILKGEVLYGESYDAMDIDDNWVPFQVNLQTKKISGGSYRQYFEDDGQPKKRSN